MKSHWWIIWKMADGSCVRDTTRGHLEPVTEEELKGSLATALRPSILQQDLEPLVWVTDADREGRPALIFTAQVVAIELEPDFRGGERLEAEVERHLQAVRDPEPEAPQDGYPAPPELGTVSDIVRSMGFRNGLPPAGLDRHA